MTEQQFKDGETSWLQMLNEVITDDDFHADAAWNGKGWDDTIEKVAINGKLLTWEQAQTNDDMNKPFDYTFGSVCGVPFTAWSAKWVYFPVQYDGAESIGRAPRNPCNHANEHVGGG